MTTKKNLYIVLTEYQLLQALNISTALYAGSEYQNIIYVLRNGKRMMILDKEIGWKLNNIEFCILDNYISKEVFEKIKGEKPNHFFIFQGNFPLNVFLGNYFSNTGVEVSLGPDGYGAYNVFNKKYHLLTVIKDSILANRKLFNDKLFSGKVLRFDYYKYGSHKFINNLWVTHPNQYVHQGKNKINIVKLPSFNEICLKFITKLFNFEVHFPKEDAIFYFNQPLPEELVEKEFGFLEGVLDRFPEKSLVIKLHPVTSDKLRKRYAALSGVVIIDAAIPAEIILLSLKQCIVLTGWSAVLITENPKCNYYFNYPIYKNSDFKFFTQSEIIVLKHITLVSSPESMKFPNE